LTSGAIGFGVPRWTFCSSVAAKVQNLKKLARSIGERSPILAGGPA